MITWCEKLVLSVCTSTIVIFGAVFFVPALAQMTPERLLDRMDVDGDGKISADEFTGRRRPFSFFDKDGDGCATRAEIADAMSRGRSGRGQVKEATQGLDGQVSRDSIDEEIYCGIGRDRHCDINLARQLGLVETGLRPRFPDGFNCRSIDENWAISYSYKRDREAYHGGIDMPAPYGTPIIAAAAGTVIAIFDGERSMRGIELILRHSPDDTGIPLWIYTAYGHFNTRPSLTIGQRVRMGEVLGPTGNSGTYPSNRPFGKERRPAIHFAVWYSKSPNFFVGRRIIVPVDGRWMDPNALYRRTPPFDSPSMKPLPVAEKSVAIPVMLEDGTTVPTNTRLVWPYTCSRD